MSGHPLYQSWKKMKERCYYRKHWSYERYGGRGITICAEWLEDPGQFFSWALPLWSPGLTVDRVDNDGPYAPWNCRLADSKTQARNTRLIRANNQSGYRGVHFHQGRGHWRGKASGHIIGVYDTPEEAARARDAYVLRESLGLPLNFPDEEGDSTGTN